ncbi:MAG: cobaltochelatase subunit CobN [Candidatus Accumulibacter sp.]|jgi:cobaltochelatase CobN|nr:cobaltochelatase subunit CobN [Accumulibacter sp.]
MGGSAWFGRVLAATAILALAAGGAAAAARGAQAPRILFVAGDPAHMQGKKEALEKAAQAAGVSFHTVFAPLLDANDHPRLFEGFDLVLIDTQTKAPADALMAGAGPKETPAAEVFANPALAAARRGVDAEVHERLREYWRHGGKLNYERMFHFLMARQFRRASGPAEPPLPVPETGVYHPRLPGLMRASAGEYLQWLRGDAAAKAPGADAPTIALVINRGDVDNGRTEIVDAMIARIEEKGAVALPVFFPDRPGAADGLRRTLMQDGRPLANALIYVASPHVPLERRAEIEAMGIPALGSARIRSAAIGGDPVEAWRESHAGIPMAGIPSALATPEFIGIADIVLTNAENKDRSVRTLIPEQFDSLIAKAFNLARLQRLGNQEKKIALMFYNSPPGEKNLSASNLNIPESVVSILGALEKSGYAVQTPDAESLTQMAQKTLAPFYRAGKLEALLDEGLAAVLPIADYMAWFGGLPEKTRAEILERWGEPERSSMAMRVDGVASFVIPRIALGNAAVLRQPPRGDRIDEREKAIYHDTKLPPNHFYLASYLWARQTFGADALVHLGTHGTQEWMPGKERGLSAFDAPNLAVGDMPVFYPYIVANIGEAMQAKRRGRAVVVSHQTPPFAPSALHSDLLRLHDLIHEYESIETPSVRDKLRAEIVELTKRGNHLHDIGFDAGRIETEFDAFLEALEGYLHELAEQNQPLGLHSFGVTPGEAQRLTTVMQMLGQPLLEALAGDSPGAATEAFAVDYRNLHENEAYKFLERHAARGEPLPAGSSPELADLAEKARRHYAALSADGEIEGLLAGLSGRHVPASPGDDPIRNADSLPTGRNLYGFDPAKVPSRQAWEAAGESFASMLEQHCKKLGRMPEKLAFTLWSVETMRQQGVLEAQIFQALGVEPVWDEGGRVTRVELVPKARLRHPRIDVLVTASGAYRDMFPNALKRIEEAVALAGAQDEDDNAIRRATEAAKADLTARGMAPEDAAKWAAARIFGPESGSYGAGLDNAILASDTFGEAARNGKEEQDRRAGEGKLANLFIGRLGHVWNEEGGAGDEALQKELFTRHLAGVDATVLARSSNLFGLVNIDDAYQYMGGLSLAVRSLSGKSPEMYIADLRNPRRAKTEKVEKMIAAELRTRYLHPNWVGEMQKEGYAGAVEMLKNINNFWGWQVSAPETVRADQWQEFHEVYVRDKFNLGLPQWFEQNAPHAQAQMIERMLEAVRKEYWGADAATVGELKARYRDLAEKYGVRSENARFSAFVGVQAPGVSAGFGLEAAAPAAGNAPAQSAEAAPPPAPGAPRVRGMRLEKAAEPSPAALPYTMYAGLLIVFLSMLGGGISGWRSPDFVSRSQRKNPCSP